MSQKIHAHRGILCRRAGTGRERNCGPDPDRLPSGLERRLRDWHIPDSTNLHKILLANSRARESNWPFRQNRWQRGLAGEMSMTRAEWICHQNIERFRNQLACAQDEPRRALLRALLREQETSLAQLKKHANDGSGDLFPDSNDERC